MTVTDLAQARQIFRRRYSDPTRRGDGLSNHRGHGLWPLVLNELLNGVNAVDVTGGIGMAVITAVAVRRGNVQGAIHKRAVVRLGHGPCAADAHRPIRRSMVRAAPSNNLKTLWEAGEILILSGNLDR